jgi:phospholipase D1/2
MAAPSVTSIAAGREPLLVPGKSCWRVARADRFAFLIDGDAYFTAVRDAMLQAERSILVIAWDIDSRIRLTVGDDGMPNKLGELLDWVARRPAGPSVHVLTWDPNMMYAFEREWLASLRWRFTTHPKVRFHMDNSHARSVSLHQKIVVIDDAVAFTGGLDLTIHRWDTAAHVPHDPRRTLPDGTPYHPFHDLMCVASGPVAAALGELGRERWRVATGEVLPAPAPPERVPWPRMIPPACRDATVGILRTVPDGPQEVAVFTEQAIAGAERLIYVESQYLTSRRVCRALCERLDAVHGPEVVVVLPKASDGWLERGTMDAKRRDVVAALRAADRRGRLGVFYAAIDRDRRPLGLHSKLLVVDDRVCRIGSANFTNRSLAIDSECDFGLLSARDGDDVHAAIRELRETLLAEHLGVSVAEYRRACEGHDSVLAGIELLRQPRTVARRTLAPIEESGQIPLELGAPAMLVADPDEPMDVRALVEGVAGPPTPAARKRAIVLALLVTSTLVIGGVWRFTSFGRSLDAATIGAWLERVSETPIGMLWVALLFAVATALGMPVTVAIGAAALALGPWRGFCVSLAGSAGASAAGFWLGRRLGYERTTEMGSKAIGRLRRVFKNRGVLTVTVVRVLPIAPFTLVNAVAGASGVRVRDFVLGTLIGMVPGMLGMSLLIDRLLAALRHPSAVTVILLLAVTAALVVFLAAYGRWIAKKRDAVEPGR